MKHLVQDALSIFLKNTSQSTKLEEIASLLPTIKQQGSEKHEILRHQLNQLGEIKSTAQSFLNILEQLTSTIMTHKVEQLQQSKQYKQKTKEWFDVRKEMLTASSDISDILGKSEYNGTTDKTIQKKLGFVKAFEGNKFTQHGNKYEKIAIQIYEERYDKQVLEFGLLRHPTIHRLGASPDGITKDGRLVEIKVPYTRIPDGKIKRGYFIQMQTQMEVCDLDVCDFFECRISEYRNKNDYDNDIFCADDILFLDICPRTTNLNLINVPNDRRTEDGLEKGMLGRIGYFSTANDNSYIYPPMHLTSNEQYQYLKNKQMELKKNGVDMKIDYWRVETSSFQPVKRDRKWWEDNKVECKIEQVWKQIEAEKEKLQLEKVEKEKCECVTENE